eukprot:CAMPEP_0117696880 /NCGR_PEP_ID=MMETSP0804-20121206/28911_1 /TAXON_ID=1074897 /ORGANISM="Tetraselmis astigmatica, Strain CCMP880" /LENGTH=282 /DNA_ID=CAMNT_0005511053 /DNA_START=34 /DNA_END=882 /DNA_ORIENTATION=+
MTCGHHMPSRPLQDDAELDAVASQVELIGWPRDGMERYIRWQNEQLSEEEMKRCRFIEIPALRASALYRRSSLMKLGGYRDLWKETKAAEDKEGTAGDLLVRDFASTSEHVSFITAEPGCAKLPMNAAVMPVDGWWPVDSDFWMRFFAAGMRCRKVSQQLYQWRQYPEQSTRTHSRCSLERLRACKIHFITGAGGPLKGRRCQVWSVGLTLEAWGQELRGKGVEVQMVSWKPGTPIPDDGRPREDGPSGWTRLFVYGSDKARRKVVANKKLGFDPAKDWFAA